MIFIDRKTKYIIAGALAGLANGFWGSGGGLFIVPLLSRWVKLPQRTAFATSVAVILPLSAVSVAVYLMRGALDLGFVWPFLLGGAVGGLISGRVFQKIPLTLLRRVFGTLILYGGVRALFLL